MLRLIKLQFLVLAMLLSANQVSFSQTCASTSRYSFDWPSHRNWFIAPNLFSGSIVDMNTLAVTSVGSAVQPVTSYEGVSAVSDDNGNLLFYTNGRRVWRGTGANPTLTYSGLLEGNEGGINNGSAAQGIIILRHPLEPTIYHILTTDDALSGSVGLNYFTFDVNGNNLTGPTRIGTYKTTEGIAATFHQNGVDIWVTVIEANSNRFRTYLLECTGLNTTPVTSNVAPNASGNEERGGISFSWDGTKLGYAGATNFPDSRISFYDFDNATGMISGRRDLTQNAGYDIVFSPNDNRAFISMNSGQLAWVDLTTYTAAAINASFTTTGISTQFAALELGPGGDLFISHGVAGGGFLRRVNENINVAGAFSTSNVPGTSGQSHLGLPTMFLPPQEEPDIIEVGPFCTSDPAVDLSTNWICAGTDAEDPVNHPNVYSGPGITNTGTGIFNPATAGTGLHQIVFQRCNVDDTIWIQVNSCGCPDTTISQPPALCADATHDLATNEVTAEAGSWSIVSTPGGGNPATIGGSIFDAIGHDAGTYRVRFTLAAAPLPACPDSAERNITVNPLPPVNVAAANATTCGGNGSLTLSGLTPLTGYNITYNDGGVVGPALMNTDAGGNIVINVSSGNYSAMTIEIPGTGCSDNDPGPWNITEPTPQNGVSAGNNPTTCGGSNGSIDISGLSNNTNYNISYTGPGGPVGPLALMTNGTGTLSITGLIDGNYTNITIEHATTLCVGTAPDVNLVDPTPQNGVSAGNNPTTCGGSNGSIDISGLSNNTNYNISYTGPGGPVGPVVLMTNGTGQLSITGLIEGNYTGITIEHATTLCVGTAPDVGLVGPVPQNGVSAGNNPTTCGGSNGSIDISGLSNNTNYNISYTGPGGPVGPVVIMTNGTGQLSITGLIEGNYTGITIEHATTLCVGNAPDVALVGPVPENGVSTGNNPTTCGGANGSIDINGLSNNTNYNISYTGPGGPVGPVVIMTNGTGQLSITGLIEGNYTGITIEHATTLCVGNVPDVTLVGPVPENGLSAGNNPTTCAGANGSIDITGLSNNTNYNISYTGPGGPVGPVAIMTNGTGQLSITGLIAGGYTGISIEHATTLCVGNAPDVNLTGPNAENGISAGNNPTTCGGSNGSIDISGLSNNTNYNISYTGPGGPVGPVALMTNGTGQLSITGLIAGNYTGISIEHATTLCVGNAPDVNLAGPTPENGISAGNNPTTCGGSNGSIDISGLSNNTNYNISYTGPGGPVGPVALMTDGTGQLTITGLIAGNYTGISIEHATTLCVGNAPDVNLVGPTPENGISAGNNPTTCGGSNGSIDISGLSNNTNYNISYTGPGGPVGPVALMTDGTGQLSITGLIEGNYTGITIEHATTLCVGNAPDVALVGPVPENGLSAGNNPTTCSGTNGSIDITGLSNNTNYNISYTGPGGPVGPLALMTNGTGQLSITGLSAGNYTGITIEHATTLCVGNAPDIVLTDPAPPVIGVTPTDPSICGGSDGNFVITGLTTGFAYDVNYLAGATPVNLLGQVAVAPGEITIGTLSAGGYNDITVTINGCTSPMVNTSLSDPGAPVITTRFTNPTTCGGTDGSITIEGLIAATAYDVIYLDDLIPVNLAAQVADPSGEILISGLDAGSYTSIQVDLAGCLSNAETETLTDPASPVIGTTKIDPATCLGTGTVTITGLNTGTQYHVDYNDPAAQSLLNQVATAPGEIVLAGLLAGNYTNITVTEVATACQSNIEAQSLVDPNAPVINLQSATDPASCGANGAIVIDGLQASTAYDIAYNDPAAQGPFNMMTNAAGEITISGGPAAYTNITATLAGCTSNPLAANLNPFTEPAAVSISAGGTICQGDNFVFTATVGSGGGASPQFEWFINNVSQGPAGPGTTLNSTTFANGDQIRVEMTGSPCATPVPAVSGTEAMTVYSVPNPVIAGGGAFCVGTSINLSITSGDSAGVSTYQWFNNGSPIGGATGTALNVNSDGNYHVVVDNNGCSASSNIEAASAQTISVSIQPIDDILLQVGQDFIDVPLTGISNGVMPDWTSLATLNNNNILTPTALQLGIGTHTFTLTDSLAGGICGDQASVSFTIRGPIKIHTAFSPQGDGSNEVWEIHGLDGYEDYIVRVYNRYGMMVHEQFYPYTPWDGYRNGSPMPVGTYYFVVDVPEIEKTYTGNVTILR